jgi:hypothetical protein
VVPVPGCAKEFVAESENKNVLDHLLTQIMIDAVELIFIPVWCERALQLSGAGKVLSERLLDLVHRD